MARLQEVYRDTIIKKLMEEQGYKNPMEVPRIEKITLNMGVGEAIADKKVIESARSDMEKVAGQKPVTTLARKSVASFKVRDGYPIGCKVTLRRERMYEFLDRLINISIPRVRDFRGLNGKHLMDVVITAWVLKSRLSSLKSIMKKSTKFAEWISLLQLVLLLTKKARHCFQHLIFHLGTNYG